MNEQLQKELLDILRSLKDGASPAWQVLVEQRSAYAWASFSIYALMAVAAVLGCIWTVRVSLRWAGKPDAGDELAAPIIASAVLGLMAIICAPLAANWLPRAVAPLGEVLGMVVK